jgi:hypothetical protein
MLLSANKLRFPGLQTFSSYCDWADGTTQSPEVLFGLHINSVLVLMLNILRTRNCRCQESMFTFVAVLGGFCKWSTGCRRKALSPGGSAHSSNKDDSCKHVKLAVADRQQNVHFWGAGS